jgi:hypothetical protein
MTPQEANKKHYDERKAARRRGERYVIHIKMGDPGATVGMELADEVYIDGVRVKNRGGAL